MPLSMSTDNLAINIKREAWSSWGGEQKATVTPQEHNSNLRRLNETPERKGMQFLSPAAIKSWHSAALTAAAALE